MLLLRRTHMPLEQTQCPPAQSNTQTDTTASTATACPKCPACIKEKCPEQPDCPSPTTISTLKPQTTGSTTPAGYLSPIDLATILGNRNALSSVSDVAFMAYRCVAPMKEFLPGATLENLKPVEKHVLDHIVGLVATIKGVDATGITPSDTLLKALGVQSVLDPLFLRAREDISNYAAAIAVTGEGNPMCCAEPGTKLQVSDMVSRACGPKEGTGCNGYISGGSMLEPIETIARNLVVGAGYCTDPPQYPRGFASHITETKVHNPEWKLFDTPSADEDAVIFAFQLLYEHHEVFLRQHWLGVVAMQNPFDAWAIADVIYTVKPDLIIETGTANGGSALMWASIMTLTGVENPRVITIDLTEPDKMRWAAVRDNPLENPLWKKHVTFILGSTLDDAILQRVRGMAQQAQRVLVMLDSSHVPDHVEREATAYCPMASKGSYCIVQDTKLDRLGWTGPREGLLKFLAAHPEFEPDRSRELLFTDHPGGYLKKTKASFGVVE